MQCPRDKSTLEKSQFMDVTMDACPYCDGVWLNEGELAELTELKQDLLLHKDEIKGVTSDKKEVLYCPQCDKPMESTYYSQAREVEIDICPQCQGIWLDTNELRKIFIIASKVREKDDK